MAHEIHRTRAIRGERESRGAHAAVAALATAQRGVITRQQLRRIGLSEDAIDRRLEAKRLLALHRGVYAVGHRRLSREARYLAAVLASGDGAILSHCSAADLWELRAPKETTIDVTVARNRQGERALRIHRNALIAGETTDRLGIPVTTPLRSLLDLAAVVPPLELERAIRQAVYRRLTTTARLAEAVQERGGRRGSKAMGKALIQLGEAPGLTRSNLEDNFVRFLRRHRLPLPELNVEMNIRGQRIEVDCIWRAQRVIVELDGRDAHDSTPAFEADRARDSALTAALWRVVRVTNRRMRLDGAQLGTDLRALLA